MKRLIPNSIKKIMLAGTHVRNLGLSNISFVHHRAEQAIVDDIGCYRKGVWNTANEAGFYIYARGVQGPHKLAASIYACNIVLVFTFEKAAHQKEHHYIKTNISKGYYWSGFYNETCFL